MGTMNVNNSYERESVLRRWMALRSGGLIAHEPNANQAPHLIGYLIYMLEAILFV